MSKQQPSERRKEILDTVNQAIEHLSDDSTVEQLDVVLLAAGFNPKAVRTFARTLVRQENVSTGKRPETGIDAEAKWARSYLIAAVRDLFAAGGSFQAVMLAAQSLPSYVAGSKTTAKEDAAKRKRPTPGNGVKSREDES